MWLSMMEYMHSNIVLTIEIISHLIFNGSYNSRHFAHIIPYIDITVRTVLSMSQCFGVFHSSSLMCTTLADIVPKYRRFWVSGGSSWGLRSDSEPDQSSLTLPSQIPGKQVTTSHLMCDHAMTWPPPYFGTAMDIEYTQVHLSIHLYTMAVL